MEKRNRDIKTNFNVRDNNSYVWHCYSLNKLSAAELVAVVSYCLFIRNVNKPISSGACTFDLRTRGAVPHKMVSCLGYKVTNRLKLLHMCDRGSRMPHNPSKSFTPHRWNMSCRIPRQPPQHGLCACSRWMRDDAYSKGGFIKRRRQKSCCLLKTFGSVPPSYTYIARGGQHEGVSSITLSKPTVHSESLSAIERGADAWIKGF